jgi:hypothetical protein
MRRPRRLVRWCVLALCFGVVGALSAALILRPNQSLAHAEQYAVYSAYIEPGLTGDSHDLGSSEGLVVIQASTVMSLRFGLFSAWRIRAAIPQLRSSVMLEFFLSNLCDRQLAERFALPAKYELANRREINLYPTEQFAKRFPGNYGYLTFSRIGFNRDLTEAVFYTEHMCGLCGEGKYVFMRKVNSHWITVGEAPTWIS